MTTFTVWKFDDPDGAEQAKIALRAAGEHQPHRRGAQGPRRHLRRLSPLPGSRRPSMSENAEAGTTGVAVPPQTRGGAAEPGPLPDTGRRGQWHSLTVPGFWGAVVV